ncbi:MAG: TRAP transporter fused permease subunit [Pseudomonadota bacterium]
MTNAVADAPGVLDWILERESGGRRLAGAAGRMTAGLAIAWSLFQLWTASPLPFAFGFGVLHDTAVRCIHLAFALLLVYLLFPARNASARGHVPLHDLLAGALAVLGALYMVLFQQELLMRPGAPNAQDVVAACVGILLLLEAVRRCLGWPMTIIAVLFLSYTFLGPWMPELVAHRGASLSRAASHFWLTTEGVFGVALGVSASFVFLYVLFGSLLEKAGAGNYLTGVAFSLLGHFRGGPAKAAILSSGLHGMVSGSSVANVLTCGAVTIPLMKRVGYPATKAGALEVAAGSNGQIMPPVMGAAAFLMVEYVNIPYTQIIKHALVPALLAYGSLLYIAHLEALKMGMVGLPRRASPLRARLLGWGLTAASLVIVINAALWVSQTLPRLVGDLATPIGVALVAATYVGLLWIAGRQPRKDFHDPASLSELPPVGTTVLSGLHFLLPLFVLVWCLTVLEQSPGLAAFYACVLMIGMLLTQGPLLRWFRGESQAGAFGEGARLLVSGLHDGARNMVGIAIATAAAGVVVGSVSLTGIGQGLAEVVEAVAGNSILGVLLLTTALSLVLGMGLPTTANYIVVSTLLAPVIVALAASNGLEVPLIAVHLFVFYFGIMADATPPVALAAYAGAGLSGADPLKTGVQAFIYEMRTAVLPFVFIFNPELLLIGDSSPWYKALVIGCAAIACATFASATQSQLLTRNRRWETAALLAATFFLMWPQAARELVYDRWVLEPASRTEQLLAEAQPGSSLRLRVSVQDADTQHMVEKTFLLPVAQGPVQARLMHMGITLEPRDGGLYIGMVDPGSPAERVRLNEQDTNRVVGVELRNPALPDKLLFTLPAFALLALVMASQWWRRARATPALKPA